MTSAASTRSKKFQDVLVFRHRRADAQASRQESSLPWVWECMYVPSCDGSWTHNSVLKFDLDASDHCLPLCDFFELQCCVWSIQSLWILSHAFATIFPLHSLSGCSSLEKGPYGYCFANHCWFASAFPLSFLLFRIFEFLVIRWNLVKTPFARLQLPAWVVLLSTPSLPLAESFSIALTNVPATNFPVLS